MIQKENPRPGGRSARVQASVHQAVRELLAQMDRADLAIPLIAQRAGVTPSTIYRRWGDLQNLLADVSVARLQPETEPAKVGSARADLEAWVEQYADEMSSGPGRQMIRDVLAAPDASNAGKCCIYTRQQLEVIAERARCRGERFPSLDDLMDHVVSPIMYRILFDQAPGPDYCRALIERLMPAPVAA